MVHAVDTKRTLQSTITRADNKKNGEKQKQTIFLLREYCLRAFTF